MKRERKKLTNMVWRSMGESILFSLIFVAVGFYFLHTYGYIMPFGSWLSGLKFALTMVGVITIMGAMFGYWQSNKVISRLKKLQETLTLLEKGNLNQTIPYLGEDEVGRLGEQLNRISEKWEDQVNSLQRLSTDNAELAEKARFSAVVEERQRLARELHDAVSQQLFAISMTATALGR